MQFTETQYRPCKNRDICGVAPKGVGAQVRSRAPDIAALEKHNVYLSCWDVLQAIIKASIPPLPPTTIE